MTVWQALVGQPRAAARLIRAAESARSVLAGDAKANLPHAWLITGPPGSGRSIAAKCLAAGLQCSGEEVGCGQCPGCVTTMAGSNLDVTVFATELVQIKIRDVRELITVAQQRPSLGRWRVIIIEDADRMVDGTSNVLLKALEEPPPRTVWVLCAPTPRDLLITIRSRCTQLQLATPQAEAVAKLLVETEGVPFSQALTAAQVAQSHVGVARAITQNPQLRQSRVEMFMGLLRVGTVGEAVVAAGHLVEAARAAGLEESADRDSSERAELAAALGLEEGKRIPPSLRSQLQNLEEDQKRRARRSLADGLDRALVDMLGFLRDVIVIQTGGETALINADLEGEVRQMASETFLAETLKRAAAIDLARRRLQGNVSPQVIIEALGVSLLNPLLEPLLGDA